MDCPICLSSTDSYDVDSLARHLREKHDYGSLDAGRTARRVQEWHSYDASRVRYVKGSPVPAAGDDSGRGGELDRDRGGLGGGDPLSVESLPVAAGRHLVVVRAIDLHHNRAVAGAVEE